MITVKLFCDCFVALRGNLLKYTPALLCMSSEFLLKGTFGEFVLSLYFVFTEKGKVNL